jgi:TetR/AcrR family transcriptional regulator, regulator of cefoperazone and chloramphenicol sensitivity
MPGLDARRDPKMPQQTRPRSAKRTLKVRSKKLPRVPKAAIDGYQKGKETRARILEVALKTFGNEGFKGATTRQIADDAGVNLPALKYYFGGKEGLYLACGHEIAARYGRLMLPVAATAHAALAAQMDAASARTHLKLVLGALAEFLLGTSETRLWRLFVQREMVNPGPAFEILYAQLWQPGLELSAALISRVLGQQATTQEGRLRALLLISSLAAFDTGSHVAVRVLGWPDLREERLELVKKAVRDQIDLIADA